MTAPSERSLLHFMQYVLNPDNSKECFSFSPCPFSWLSVCFHISRIFVFVCSGARYFCFVLFCFHLNLIPKLGKINVTSNMDYYLALLLMLLTVCYIPLIDKPLDVLILRKVTFCSLITQPLDLLFFLSKYQNFPHVDFVSICSILVLFCASVFYIFACSFLF